MKFTTTAYLLGTVIIIGLLYLLYPTHYGSESSKLPNDGSESSKLPNDGSESSKLPNDGFSQRRKSVVSAQSFNPMMIPTNKNSSFDYKAVMARLNEAQVPQDDPRLIKLIRDYYLDPPSQAPYNLLDPQRLEYSNGQTPFIDSRLNYIEGGFYIEAGALNGEKGSNTLFFEKVRKWNGLLVEPDPSNYAALRSKNRKAYTINACLHTEPYPALVSRSRTA